MFASRHSKRAPFADDTDALYVIGDAEQVKLVSISHSAAMDQTTSKASSDDDDKSLERQGIDFVTLGMFIIGETSQIFSGHCSPISTQSL